MASKPDPHWIEHSHMNKGGLHRALHVPEGQKIPDAKMVKAEHSNDPHVRAMAHMAENMGATHGMK